MAKKYVNDSGDLESEGQWAPAVSPGKRAMTRRVRAGKPGGQTSVVDTAEAGVKGSGGALPYSSAIQRAFGGHDITGVVAHVDEGAKRATDELGAPSYAKGNHIAFGRSPDLFTAAHEAAHVVQQRAGLISGVGTPGDAFEQHADRVAEQVVAGQSAEETLTELVGAPGGGASAGDAVQFLGERLDRPIGDDEEFPEHGETPNQQRRWSVEQYVEMWQEEQGRDLTEAELATIARGCIGITATNLQGGGNPPLDHAYATFEQAHKKLKSMKRIMMTKKIFSLGIAKGKQPVLFAKLFWSNQSPSTEQRKQPNEEAFQPNKKGEVDMADYKYRAQPGFVNFDYGFWDETSQSVWHANHSQPGMKVYQSTRETFEAGYADFDRLIWCVAIAENYNPRLAVLATMNQ